MLVKDVAARPLMAVRETVEQSELSSRVPALLGEVWQYLTARQVTSTGHNVVLYHAAHGAGTDLSFDASFGVEVSEPVPASDRVVATATPSGRAVTTVHWGDYAGLGAAYAAIRAWCDATDQQTMGTSWEVYGDWFDDWSQVRTDLFFLLET